MATISDVAKAAGVSKATVSRVLSGNTFVSAQFTEQVRQAMKVLNYRPNALAQGLASKRSNGIGMVVNELGGPYYGLMMSGVEKAIEAHGMHLIVASGHARKDRERAAVEFLLERQCDGLVLHLDALDDDELVDICQTSTPIVIINRQVPRLETCSIYSDDKLGGRLATRYLIANGHKRIACMTGPLTMHESCARLYGYEAILCESGLAVDPALIVESDFTVEGGYRAASTFFARTQDVTAIFAQNDQMAAGIFNACREKQLVVPDDISVVGFDDVELAHYVYPKLTTVKQQVHEMGMAAGRCLMHALGRDTSPKEQRDELVSRLRPQLIERDSVRCIT